MFTFCVYISRSHFPLLKVKSYKKILIKGKNGVSNTTFGPFVEGSHEPVHRVQAAVAGQVLDSSSCQVDDGTLLRPEAKLLHDCLQISHQGSHLLHNQPES